MSISIAGNRLATLGNLAWGGDVVPGGLWVDSIYTSNVALGHAFVWSIFRGALAMLEMVAVVMIH